MFVSFSSLKCGRGPTMSQRVPYLCMRLTSPSPLTRPPQPSAECWIDLSSELFWADRNNHLDLVEIIGKYFQIISNSMSQLIFLVKCYISFCFVWDRVLDTRGRGQRACTWAIYSLSAPFLSLTLLHRYPFLLPTLPYLGGAVRRRSFSEHANDFGQKCNTFLGAQRPAAG